MHEKEKKRKENARKFLPFSRFYCHDLICKTLRRLDPFSSPLLPPYFGYFGCTRRCLPFTPPRVHISPPLCIHHRLRSSRLLKIYGMETVKSKN